MDFDRVKLLSSLKRHEGYRRFAYDDRTGQELRPGDSLEGALTIGYGHNLTARGISMAVGSQLLTEDVMETAVNLAGRYPWIGAVDEVRRRVLVELGFNMGIGTLAKFSPTLALMRAGQWNEAADRLALTPWHRQVGVRATELEAMLRTGQDSVV